eukprot:2994407-Rhodomonas_salina.2
MPRQSDADAEAMLLRIHYAMSDTGLGYAGPVSVLLPRAPPVPSSAFLRLLRLRVSSSGSGGPKAKSGNKIHGFRFHRGNSVPTLSGSPRWPAKGPEPEGALDDAEKKMTNDGILPLSPSPLRVSVHLLPPPSSLQLEARSSTLPPYPPSLPERPPRLE